MMAQPRFRRLTDEQAVKQIINTVARAEPGEAPFALVLGSGFSAGLVPTVNEIVTCHLPLWDAANGDVDAYRSLLAKTSGQEQAGLAGSFWSRFEQNNRDRDLHLKLTPAGLPDLGHSATAYQAVFNPDYDSIVGAPADARKFQQALMQLDRFRLNAAHFLLASLLGVQSGRSRASELFRFASAFSRLILTTNFDPFLQIALQLVNRLYYMSDKPDLGVGDEILDDHTDAIHLVYMHGSVHRRLHAASEDEIRAIKEKNAITLAPVLKRRGVIVLGYSGWDDAIIEALCRCGEFDHRLYWCGRTSDPLATGAFGPRVPEILGKRSASYVLTHGAGHFMHRLYNGLVRRPPRLLDNPTAQMRDMLENLDLSELAELKGVAACADDSVLPPLEKARRHAIDRLKLVEAQFLGTAESGAGQDAAGMLDGVARAIESAQLALGIGKHEEALALCERTLKDQFVDVSRMATLLHMKAQAQFVLEQYPDSIATSSELIALAGATEQQRARALMQRGTTYLVAEQVNDALHDFTRLIEMQGLDTETKAAALISRAMAFASAGSPADELADYDKVIDDMPHVSSSTLVAALLHRGDARRRCGKLEAALKDFSRVTRTPGATDGQIAKAIFAFGLTGAELPKSQPNQTPPLPPEPQPASVQHMSGS
jgi:tetratricopeptide (TPR) repeat protein